MNNPQPQDDSLDKYIVFQMGTELFATSLLEVREVIEPQEPKPIPNMARFFKGVINIRGEIIGVIDLREKMGISTNEKPLCQLVFDTPNGPLAAIVDKVQSVIPYDIATLERRTNMNQGVDHSYFIGLGKVDETIVTFISLPKVISEEALTAINKDSTP